MPDEGSPKTGDPRIGIRIAPAMASLVVALTTVTLHPITPGRTAIIRKVIIANRNAASTRVRIGSGDFNQRIPEFFVGAGLDLELNEEELPRYEFRSLVDAALDITAQATVAAAATADVQVLIEVEEFAEQ